MPIEFSCPNCGKRLRTGDDTAGRQAKCPACETITTVPSGAALPAPPAAEPPPHEHEPDAFPHDNPYAAGEATTTASIDAVPQGEVVPSPFEIGEVMSTAWTVMRDRLGFTLGVFWLALVINWILAALVQAPFPKGRDAELWTIPVEMLLSIVVSAWLNAGMVNVALKLGRGQPAVIGDVFDGGRWLLPVLAANVLWTLAIYVGMALCIIPGIIVSLMFSQCVQCVVDRNLGPIDALSLSAKITNGNKLTLFALFILLFLLGIVAVIPCGLGMIVFAPYCIVLMGVCYLRMSGQRVCTDPSESEDTLAE